jgi:dihydrofolate reductase
MYEVMAFWETALENADEPAVFHDYARIWQSAEKIVYSTTLEKVSSGRTRIERDFDPAAVRQMKARSARDITVGGPELAGQALKAGLVDELQLFLVPVIVGGGKRALPLDLRTDLELRDHRRFSSGVIYGRYGIMGTT